MADKHLGDDEGPSLELPSLGSLLRRKKKASAEPVEPAEQVQESEQVEPVKPDEETEPVESSEGAGPVDVRAKDPEDEPTAVVPVTDTEVDAEPTRVLSEPEPEPERVRPVEDADAETTTDDEAADEPDGVDEADEDREFAVPSIGAPAAAAITGLVVGGLAVAFTWLALQGCEQVRGTSTCGKPGFLLLTVIMIVLVVIGGALLGYWSVTEARGTSLLAVALLAVIALLFLIPVIFSPWMIAVIPIVAVCTFVFSQWLTAAFVEDDSVGAHA